jgi:hypothetical protein
MERILLSAYCAQGAKVMKLTATTQATPQAS